MKPFDEINTSLPYEEDDEYVERLVARCRDNAIRRSKTKTGVKKVRPWLYGTLSVVAAAIVVAIFIWKPIHDNGIMSPIDSFLSSLSEEEVQMISGWTIDEIPEYL